MRFLPQTWHKNSHDDSLTGSKNSATAQVELNSPKDSSDIPGTNNKYNLREPIRTETEPHYQNLPPRFGL